jgi:hypothetical protein
LRIKEQETRLTLQEHDDDDDYDDDVQNVSKHYNVRFSVLTAVMFHIVIVSDGSDASYCNRLDDSTLRNTKR